MTDDQDGTGYRQPPKASRFKKGQSGNPRGRPRGSSNFKTELAAELRETVVLIENGRKVKITKGRAVIKSLTAAAIQKDIRAVNALLACIRLFGVGAEDPQPPEGSGRVDLEFLEEYLASQRSRAAGPDATKTHNPYTKEAKK